MESFLFSFVDAALNPRWQDKHELPQFKNEIDRSLSVCGFWQRAALVSMPLIVRV
ncbi:MAG: hypothetical protein ACLPND_08300 [Candidatus Korobacteraceae bacterium]